MAGMRRDTAEGCEMQWGNGLVNVPRRMIFRRPRAGTARLRDVAGMGLAVWLALGASGAAQTASPKSLAPDADFSKICRPAPEPRLTRDWSAWDKSQPVGDPEDMY